MSISTQTPRQFFLADQIRQLDDQAINIAAIPAAILMKRAGRRCFRELQKRYPDTTSITVFCGGGNNAGDGYVVAALACQAGISAQVFWLSDPSKLQGAALQAYSYARQEGATIEPFDPSTNQISGVIVDALLGLGFTASNQLRGNYPAAIAQINASDLPVVSVDLPSGLDASTGAAAEPCVKASLTCTFIAEKLGLVTGAGPAVTGEVVLDTLAVPDHIYRGQTATAHQLNLSAALAALSPRPANAHKGNFGRCLVVAGSTGMAGAGLMAAEACARMGAGTVTLATAEQNTVAANVRCPEIMAQPVAMGADLEPLLAKCSHLAVGPGLGQTGWGQRMLQTSLQAGCATVVDADGLNLLATKEQLPEHAAGQWILTPHPAEAARLLGTSTREVQADRARAARELARKYQATVVLKGAGSLVASTDGELWVCTQGNPGMASGGMGDVLTGLILGIWPQVKDSLAAAKLAVALHACAADNLTAEHGQRGLLASDLIPEARRLINRGE